MRIEHTGSELVAVERAAEIVGLAPGTLNNLRRTGGGPKFYKVRARCLYRVSDLEDYLRSCERSGGSIRSGGSDGKTRNSRTP